MAAIQRSEFALALNQIASERGVDPSVVLETMKGAILAAYRKDTPVEEEDVEKYTVDLNENTGETRVLMEGKDVTPPGFGRIAAQTAKQVLLQKIREKEKDAIISEYTKRVGTVVNGMILRFVGPSIVLDIGKAEALMEPSEKIPTEQYFINKKMPVFIKGIDDEKREIMVSRADPGLIEGLVRREVPEVSSGSVTIKKVVREAGNRAKIAVYSEQSGIDPVGSCVGQKGVRIQAVIDALDGLEKIDVIQWSPDPVKLITNALSPAKNLVVETDEKEKSAKVRAPREELPLIIGREGQNVRLASKLTEYEIEVEGDDSLKIPEAEPQRSEAGEKPTERSLAAEPEAEKTPKVEEKVSPKEESKETENMPDENVSEPSEIVEEGTNEQKEDISQAQAAGTDDNVNQTQDKANEENPIASEENSAETEQKTQ
jgi:N utilization substance protein A